MIIAPGDTLVGFGPTRGADRRARAPESPYQSPEARVVRHDVLAVRPAGYGDFAAGDTSVEFGPNSADQPRRGGTRTVSGLSSDSLLPTCGKCEPVQSRMSIRNKILL
jgi:hypothetical protein